MIQNPRPRRLLLFNLVTDADDPVLGFTSLWIRALAARTEQVEVLTMRQGRIDLPPNVRVHSVGLEAGLSRPRRLLRFYSQLSAILRAAPIDGCFSHMMPLFSALGGPVLRTLGIPLVTWYAHPSLTRTLKAADFMSNRMVTSLPGAYPYRADKLTVIGQGIDTALFHPVSDVPVNPHMILCVGRLSQVKDHPTLLRAFAQLLKSRPDLRLHILGAALREPDRLYLESLRQLTASLGISDRVAFEKPVPFTELPLWYSKCNVHVNLTPAGFGDKVAWEAMACGRPCLVANADFAETLGRHAGELSFPQGDAPGLAARLGTILDTSDAHRSAVGTYLRGQVMRLHSIDGLTDRILNELEFCRTGVRVQVPAGVS